jgi:hypothetical protein
LCCLAKRRELGLVDARYTDPLFARGFAPFGFVRDEWSVREHHEGGCYSHKSKGAWLPDQGIAPYRSPSTLDRPIRMIAKGQAVTGVLRMGSPALVRLFAVGSAYATARDCARHPELARRRPICRFTKTLGSKPTSQ